MRGRILVVDQQTPTPDQDGGSASTFADLRILATAGFKVTFASPALADAGRYTQALSDLGISVPTSAKWSSLNAVIQALGPRTDVFLLYRGKIAKRVIDLAQRVAPAAKIVFGPIDLAFVRIGREAVLTGDETIADAARLLKDVEINLVKRANATIVVSDYEHRLLKQLVPEAVVHQIPILWEPPSEPPGILGWRRLCRNLPGTKLGAMGRRIVHRGPKFGARRDLVFIGSAHRPNVDGILWFLREVWPRIQAQGFPDRFIVAGANLPSEITAPASDKIDVRGYVADLGPLFDACRLSIAPLRFGAGIKGKIISSLSYSLPVVASSIAVEGMGLQHEKDVLVADAPDEMAHQILRLYGDAELWRRLAENGYETFHTRFSEAAGAPKLLAVFDGLMRSAK